MRRARHGLTAGRPVCREHQPSPSAVTDGLPDLGRRLRHVPLTRRRGRRRPGRVLGPAHRGYRLRTGRRSGGSWPASTPTPWTRRSAGGSWHPGRYRVQAGRCGAWRVKPCKAAAAPALRYIYSPCWIRATVLGQVDVDGKTDELTRFRPLLAPLDLTSVVVTADALHTQREHARRLVDDKKAASPFTVKKNQPRLYHELKTLPWTKIPIQDESSTWRHGRYDKPPPARRHLHRHARTEPPARRVGTTDPPPTNEPGRGRSSAVTGHSITNLGAAEVRPAYLADWLHGRSASEALHHIRDTTYGEDASRPRTSQAPSSWPPCATLRSACSGWPASPPSLQPYAATATLGATRLTFEYEIDSSHARVHTRSSVPPPAPREGAAGPRPDAGPVDRGRIHRRQRCLVLAEVELPEGVERPDLPGRATTLERMIDTRSRHCRPTLFGPGADAVSSSPPHRETGPPPTRGCRAAGPAMLSERQRQSSPAPSPRSSVPQTPAYLRSASVSLGNGSRSLPRRSRRRDRVGSKRRHPSERP